MKRATVLFLVLLLSAVSASGGSRSYTFKILPWNLHEARIETSGVCGSVCGERVLYTVRVDGGGKLGTAEGLWVVIPSPDQQPVILTIKVLGRDGKTIFFKQARFVNDNGTPRPAKKASE